MKKFLFILACCCVTVGARASEMDLILGLDNPYADLYNEAVGTEYLSLYNDIVALEEKYNQALARENSLANRTLTAASMLATGIGGQMLASGLAEQSADAAAERDMRAYLATFTCDYGAGRNIRGGQTNIELPGGNELIEYVSEYKQLAARLKATKEALGMAPGIESEIVFDAADTHLYDSVSIGTQPGAFTSLARALSEPDGADAAAWATQKESAKSKTQTGGIVAGAGAVGSLIGNLVINKHKEEQKNEKQ